jgi:hypothetical protein
LVSLLLAGDTNVMQVFRIKLSMHRLVAFVNCSYI